MIGYLVLDFVGCVDTRKSNCDNSAAVFFSKNDKYSKGAKHMELKYFAIKEEVQKRRVSIEHISTTLMIAKRPLCNLIKLKGLIGYDGKLNNF